MVNFKMGKLGFYFTNISISAYETKETHLIILSIKLFFFNLLFVLSFKNLKKKPYVHFNYNDSFLEKNKIF